MGKRALHPGPHKCSVSSLPSQRAMSSPPPSPPPPPLPPYPTSRRDSDACSKSNEFGAGPQVQVTRGQYENTPSLGYALDKRDGQFFADMCEEKLADNFRDCPDNFHLYGASLLLQSQIQRLVESGKCSNTVRPLERLLLDSGKSVVSRTELHRILCQHLAKKKRLSSSLTRNDECEQLNEYVIDDESADSCFPTSKTDVATRDSQSQLAELSLSLDSCKPPVFAAASSNDYASSMPELAHQIGPISTYRSKKGNLTVRFENVREYEEKENVSAASNSNDLFDSRRHRRLRRYKNNDDDDDDDNDNASDSYCSTCSSSSSGDDPTVYQLPVRRPYAGGVRISYVPNDTLAVAKHQQQSMANRSTSKKLNDDKNCVIS